MFRASARLTVVVLILLPWVGAASSPPREAALMQAIQATAGAWNRGDIDGFMAPYATSATYMTPAGLIGVAAMRARYLTKYFTGASPDQQLRFDQLDVRALGADHALMTGRYTLTGGGKPDQTGRFTLVWVRTPAGWRIIHDHSS
jgi:uncharacterized protein (TIGR02246 family)